MARDLEGELRQHDGSYPAAWKPQPGDTLVGTVVAYTTAPNNYGGEVRVVTVERENGAGRTAVWLGNVALLNAFAKEKPRVGERIGLKFVDTVTTKSGRQCKRYVLLVDREDASEPDLSPTGFEEQDDHDDDQIQDPFGDLEEPPLPEPPGHYARETMAPAGRRRWN